MIYFSTGLRTAMLGTVGFKDAFDGVSVIKVYSGSVPANADASIGAATLLATVTVAGGTTFAADCLDFGTPASGAVAKDGSVWKTLGANVTSGTPTFWRLVVQATDSGAASTSQYRVQGTCGTGAEDLNTGTGTTVNGTDYPVSYCTITFPASA